MESNRSNKMSKSEKKAEFKRYLETSGVLDAIVKPLVTLYSLDQKPDDPIEFVRNNIGKETLDHAEHSSKHKLKGKESKHNESEIEEPRKKDSKTDKHEGDDKSESKDNKNDYDDKNDEQDDKKNDKLDGMTRKEDDLDSTKEGKDRFVGKPATSTTDKSPSPGVGREKEGSVSADEPKKLDTSNPLESSGNDKMDITKLSNSAVQKKEDALEPSSSFDNQKKLDTPKSSASFDDQKKLDTTKPSSTFDDQKKLDTPKSSASFDDQKKLDSTKPSSTFDDEKKSDMNKPSSSFDDQKKVDTIKPSFSFGGEEKETRLDASLKSQDRESKEVGKLESESEPHVKDEKNFEPSNPNNPDEVKEEAPKIL